MRSPAGTDIRVRLDGRKAIADNGDFQTLLAGELLNYPDTWPQTPEAKPVPAELIVDS